MNRRWLNGLLPDRSRVRHRLGLSMVDDRPVSRWLGRMLHDPALWCPTRHAVAGGVATGLFVSWFPIPLQMVVAAILASVLRVHVPVSVVMVWFTNPLTIPPLLYAAWRTGSMLLGESDRTVPHAPTLAGMVARLGDVWPTVLAGCLFWAAVSAVTGFLLTRLLWRLLALRRWRQRRDTRMKRR